MNLGMCARSIFLMLYIMAAVEVAVGMLCRQPRSPCVLAATRRLLLTALLHSHLGTPPFIILQ